MDDTMVVAVNNLLGYLECPTSRVAEEARASLRHQLNEVKDSWLMAGLLNYFLQTNSPHALDMILSAPEHHDKHLLNLLSEGVKHPSRRFRFTCLIFQGIRRNSMPTWLRRLPRHSLMKELLNVSDLSADVTSLVASVAVVVTLVTVIPHDVAKHCLNGVLDMFWRLMHWTPKRQQDATFTDFLRVTLYSLFTRLYSLFPCNVVNYIRRHTINAENRVFFASTVRPMVERVRLHPMLFTFTKELEVDSKLNIYRDSSETLKQCNRISLDAQESTCEEPPILHDPDVCKASFVEGNKCWVHMSADSFFWSPSHALSPQPVRLDLPPSNMHTPSTTPLTTPIYSRTPMRMNIPLSMPESPPEAAIEATPETTPYTTPLLSDVNRQMLAQNMSSINQSKEASVVLSNAFTTMGNSRIRPGNAMSKKFMALNKEREEVNRANAMSSGEKSMVNQLSALVSNGQIDHSLPQPSSIHTAENAVFLAKTSSNKVDEVPPMEDRIDKIQDKSNESAGCKSEVKDESHSNRNCGGRSDRMRKKPAFKIPDVDMLGFTKCDTDSPSPGIKLNEKLEHQSVGENTPTAKENNSEAKTLEEDSRKVSMESSASCEEEDARESQRGLGPPSESSLSALVKTAKSNRLRFLSQCGPPLDDAQIESIMPEEKRVRKISQSSFIKHRSKSCSSFDPAGSNEGTVAESPSAKQASMIPRLPSNLAIGRYDIGTQTSASASTDPYEKLIETFISAIELPASTNKTVPEGSLGETESPHSLLRNYIQRKVIDCSDPLPEFDLKRLNTADDRLKSQVYAMYSLMMLERHKREIHANRNRSLLSKTKRLHVILEERNGLNRKLEACDEASRDLTSNNLYMSSCYQKMMDRRNKENAEKDRLLKDYSEGKKLKLSDTVLSSVSRTIKTSKGEESKDVIVLLHRSDENEEDKLKDALMATTCVLSHYLKHVCEEREELKLRVSSLEQHVSKHRSNEERIEIALREKEHIRQRMAVIMTRLTILEELNLQLQEQSHTNDDSLFDSNRKHEQFVTAWQREQVKCVAEVRALKGLTSAATLRATQLEQQALEKDKEHEQQYSEMKRFSDSQKSKVQQLEAELNEVKKERDLLRNNVSQASARADVFKTELDLLRSRSGYSRSGSSSNLAPVTEGASEASLTKLVTNIPSSAFFKSTQSSELKPITSEVKSKPKK